jgi:hypothetical protein
MSFFDRGRPFSLAMADRSWAGTGTRTHLGHSEQRRTRAAGKFAGEADREEQATLAGKFVPRAMVSRSPVLPISHSPKSNEKGSQRFKGRESASFGTSSAVAK